MPAAKPATPPPADLAPRGQGAGGRGSSTSGEGRPGGNGSGRPGWPAPGSLVTSAQRAQAGKQARRAVPRESHASLALPAGRGDPVDLLEQQSATRLQDLVPVRYGRMAASPFAYFRGAALPMAADLAATPVTGLTVQGCGDAHLSNFGAFGSPERRLVFDVNDFDETLPAPWEWDVKRLAASAEIAGRENGLSAGQRRKVVLATVSRYREAMRAFAAASSLDVWYASLPAGELDAQLKPAGARKSVAADLARARSSDSMQELAKLTRVTGGRRQIISGPPLLVPVRDLAAGTEDAGDGLAQMLHDLLVSYRSSLPPDMAQLLGRYECADIARKVVGVGSVGMRCWIVLMLAPDGDDPLFLQVKEAEQPAAARFTGRGWPGCQGERVVLGQRFMQAASDIFLGWIHVARGLDGTARDYYVRQLRDWKLSFDVAGMAPDWLAQYAGYCGWTLARAHAKTGDRFAISAYLGSSGAFDQAVATYAASYADQNEADYAAFRAAVSSGRLRAQTGV